MQRVTSIYTGLLYAMAWVAGATLVWLMVSVILSVLMRNAGVQPFAWLFTSAEYGLLYMTMLGAPWLVREKGHVHIELVTAVLPEWLRNIVSRFVALLCVIVCFILAYKGYQLCLSNIQRNDFDVRAYYFPKWMLSIAFPISFGFMTVEFLRFVVGRDLLHTGDAGIHE